MPPINALPKKALPTPNVQISSLGLMSYRLNRWLASSRPYLMLLGLSLFIFAWYLCTEVLKLPRFEKVPGPAVAAKEWFSRDPVYGISIFVPEYYQHILKSVLRVLEAFGLATLLGVPLGLFMGWKKTFKDYSFPILETLRPIPMLAWVPLAILMWPIREAAIIYLTFLAAFFATTLNTLLGVESIDEVYFRAARCLGAKPRHIFFRVVIPGALPFIFTGLQISMGVSWFSLVAGEMLAGEYGLGYLIWNSFIMVQYPIIVIAMVTLGFIGWASSAMIRFVGNLLMKWKVREAAL
ncbi:MAG TPA: ABC transporter permease [Thermodesulfobacteriota bacterium]|nr:ABC transporter permease [Thermodesulfobacteriota bacterium]